MVVSLCVSSSRTFHGPRPLEPVNPFRGFQPVLCHPFNLAESFPWLPLTHSLHFIQAQTNQNIGDVVLMVWLDLSAIS